MNNLGNTIWFLGETMDSFEVIDYEFKKRTVGIFSILYSLYTFSYLGAGDQ